MGEFLQSLDRVDALDARLALAGHARPFTDVRGHISANRALVDERLGAVRAALAGGPRTAYEIAQAIHPDWSEEMGSWQLALTRAWLTHLEALGRLVKAPPEGEDPAEHWAPAG